MSAEHWRRANDPHPRDRASFIPEWMPLLEKSGGLEWVEGAHCPVRQRRLGRYLAHWIREIPGGIPADAYTRVDSDRALGASGAVMANMAEATGARS